MSDLEYSNSIIELLYNKFKIRKSSKPGSFVYKVTSYVFIPRSTKELDATYKLIMRSVIAQEMVVYDGTPFASAWHSSKRSVIVERDTMTYRNLETHDDEMSKLQSKLLVLRCGDCDSCHNHEFACYGLDNIKIRSEGSIITKLTIDNDSSHVCNERGRIPRNPLYTKQNPNFPIERWVTIARPDGITVADLLSCLFRVKDYKFDDIFEEYSTCASTTKENCMFITLIFNHGV